MRAALDGADATRLVRRALRDDALEAGLSAAAHVDLLAVGKAAPGMLDAFRAADPAPIRAALAVGSGDAGHPIPDRRSMAAAREALTMASRAGRDDLLVVLLSGGASSLMALPAFGLSLDDKQATVARLLSSGADITELNAVRKHLSDVKGGRLATACAGSVLTLAISDVVGDDPAVIGSGPTTTDPTTWQMAIDVLDRRGGRAAYPAAVTRVLALGAVGSLPDTPKPDDVRLARSTVRVIGGASDAVAAAKTAAEGRGYAVLVLPDPVIGEARRVARQHLERAVGLASSTAGRVCVLSAGETTVRVEGAGRGGRNQEFALALAEALAAGSRPAVIASVGTDGVDGPTDAAGAVVDTTTVVRAAAAGLAEPRAYLDDNNSYEFFSRLGDLIATGPTGTNVGDVQVALFG